VIVAGLLVAGLVAAVWKAADVRRDPRDLARWAILLAISAVVLTLALEAAREYPATRFGLDERWLRLGENIAIIAAFAALQLFYLHYVAAYLRRGRLRLEIAVIAAVLAALSALTAHVIAAGGDLGSEAGNVAHLDVAGFYLVGGAYIGYALATQLCAAGPARWSGRTTAGTAAGNVHRPRP